MRVRHTYAGVTAAVLVGLALVPGAAGAKPRGGSGSAGAACGLDSVPRDAWYRIPSPGAGTWSTGMVDDDPCVLVAASGDGTLKRSDDGGHRWVTVRSHPAGLAGVFTEGLGHRVLVAERTGGGFLLSNDDGRTFVRKGLTSTVSDTLALKSRVTAVAGAGDHLVLARVPDAIDPRVRGVGAPTIYLSANGGDTWTESAISATLAPVAVAYDAVYDAAFVADGTPGSGGVWRSDDGGGTFKQVYAATGATDLVITPLQGGGQAIYLAATSGVYDSVDGGGGWGKEGSDAVRALRPEWGRSGVLTALFDTPQVRPGRSWDAGATFTLNDKGVPGSCAGTALERTTDVPSYFELDCADGTAYRYLSSGADFVGSVPPAGGPSSGPGGLPGNGLSLPTTKMAPIRSWPLHGVSEESGSIAFDGALLYFGDERSDENGFPTLSPTVHRMNARTGKDLPTVNVGVPVFALDVDRDRRTLFVQDDGAAYATGLLGGKAKKLFDAGRSAPAGVAYSWDPTLQSFWTFSHGGADIYLVSRSGQVTSHCQWGTQQGVYVGIGSVQIEGAAAIAAAGDGTAYVELEDDSTVLRVSRRCGIEAAFEHPRYSEVGAENDAITCDTNSFHYQAAIWIRDGDAKTVTAYEVPGGYCPLPTTMSITAPVRLALVSRAVVCALLRLPWGPAVPDADVALFADSVPLGVGRTDAGGRVCAAYSPSVQHAVGAAGAGRKPLQAVFLGNPSYRASDARGALTVLAAPVVTAPLPRGALAVVEPPPPAPHQPVNAPAPHVQAAVRQAQSQAQAQAQAQPVSQGNPNAVIVAQQQEQPQLAFVMEGESRAETATEWEMSALNERRRGPPLAPFGLAACGVAMAAACAFAHRTARARAG